MTIPFPSRAPELYAAGSLEPAAERAHVVHTSARTMRHASVLATAARSLAGNTSARAMYADIMRIARASLGADGTAIYLADPLTHAVELAYSEGLGSTTTPLVLERFWSSSGGEAVRTGIACFHPDIRQLPPSAVIDSIIRAGVTSLALLPLVVEGRSCGLLVLRFTTRQAFEPEQRELLTDFATHASLALRSAMQLASLERRAGRLAAVAKVQQAISAALSLEEVYAEIYRAVASVVDAPCFALLCFDEERELLVPAYVVRDGQPVDCARVPRLPLGDDATSQAFRSGAPNIAACSHRGWTGTAQVAECGRQIAAVLNAPIVHGERVLGVVQAQSLRHDAYDWEDMDIITLVAAQAGTAIAKARVYEAERQAREEAEAAFAIARAALEATDVDDAVREIRRILDAAAPGAAVGLDVASGGCGASAGASGTTIPLHSRGAPIGAITLAPAAEPQAAVARQRAMLTRLAAPTALALDTLLLRQEEQRERVRERTMAAALETMEQPVFICSTRSLIQHANGAAVREYGYSLEEFIGMHERVLRIAPAGQTLANEFHDAMRARGVWTGELLQRRKDGSEFPAWVTMSAIRDDEGHAVGVVVSVRNLTEEHRLAEQLRQTEKLVALGELVAGVVHEVNNPLTGISTFAQLLQDEALTAEQAEAIQMIKREADRAVTVVRDLLTFARKSGPRSVRVDCNELIHQTLRLRTYGLRTAGVEVVLELARDLRPVHGDDRQLQQVLLNLLVNAEHAMATVASRRLVIRTRNEVDRVVVEIADSGIGMTPEIQKRIFEPFFTTKGDGKGTGLGLSVSYGIVQSHGGTLTVHSAPGAGATFRLSLPAATATDAPARGDGARVARGS